MLYNPIYLILSIYLSIYLPTLHILFMIYHWWNTIWPEFIRLGRLILLWTTSPEHGSHQSQKDDPLQLKSPRPHWCPAEAFHVFPALLNAFALQDRTQTLYTCWFEWCETSRHLCPKRISLPEPTGPSKYGGDSLDAEKHPYLPSQYHNAGRAIDVARYLEIPGKI